MRRTAALGFRRLRRTCPVEVRTELDGPFADRLRALGPDLIVSWFWTRKLPRAVLDVAPAIGVHPSLLPRWRGPDPYFWAIASGDEVTGVTVHALEEEYDTGAILAQRELRIEPSWNAWTLARKLDRPSLALLRAVVSDFAKGAAAVPRPQDERLATLAPEPEDLEIRWSQPAAHIERLIRAAAPWPGAFTDVHGRTVVITKAALAPRPANLLPGEALVKDGVAVVCAADAGLALLQGRLEENDTALDACALARLVAQYV